MICVFIKMCTGYPPAFLLLRPRVYQGAQDIYVILRMGNSTFFPTATKHQSVYVLALGSELN